MNRFALISLSAAAAFGMIAPAQAQLLKSQFKFTHEASGYEVKANRNGETLNLIGNNPVTGSRFKLAVQPSGLTTGTVDGKPVKFVAGEKSSLEKIASAR